MRAFCLILLFSLPSMVFGQVPGNVLELNGAAQFVDFDEVLDGVRTISFWIKPTTAIDSSNASEKPILVRDNNGPEVFSTGEFAIFFGKSGTPEAGHLVFNRATVSAAYKIKSDRNWWSKNIWFHVAAVLDPQSGMKLYINGVLQQETHASTEPIYMRQEGSTGALYLGKWGFVSGFGIEAEFDELRFYIQAKTQQHIRDYMCKTESSSSATHKGYYNFDNASYSLVPTLTGIITGQATGLTTASIKKSNAPVGANSDNLYNFNGSSALTSSQNVLVTIDSMISPAKGVHLYRTPDPKLQLNGSIGMFYGVWFTDTAASYNINFDYAQLGIACDSCNELSSREFQTVQFWAPRTLVHANCQFELKNESPGNLSHREEYWLQPKLELKTGLKDTISQCEGYKVVLAPANYPGAQYLWDDGSMQQNRIVDTSGTYYVTVRWHGCEVTDSVFVTYSPVPYFSLPNDTAICVGDTFVIEAPLNIDSATYMWGNGIHFGRKFRMYFAGTISLKITVGDCSWEDEITVDVIKNFQLNLGPDTTLCLGEELVLHVPPNVDFDWSTGSNSRSIRVFNTPQKIWLSAWNKCFSRSDTISISYEECDCHFYVANSFTPNGDDVNDEFFPVSDCYYEEYEMMIFDRWGNMVFITDDYKNGWDGFYQGQKMPEGIYSYQLRYKKYTWLELSEYQRGTLTIIY